MSPFSPSWLGAATHLAVSIRQFWGCAMVDCAPIGGGQGTRLGPPEVKAAGDALQQMQKNVASETDTAGFSGIQPLPNTRQMGLTPSPPRFTLDRDEIALVVAPTPSTRSGPALGGRLAALFSIRLVSPLLWRPRPQRGPDPHSAEDSRLCFQYVLWNLESTPPIKKTGSRNKRPRQATED